ncbi:uncharacterized protein LOC108113460 [Drosophila eugracilis]|uniref:uncharacterized protein LOC108113460 n=1 Tax=Drosophila eugracilis TaxID=29029 RepID=UPI001BDA56BB|nr:uncharacterized protein LOC108113460 [Drosophila eugracilis]
MPKKPQHLSLAANMVGGYGSGPSKPKYSLTLHNNKLAAGGSGGTSVNKHLRDGHLQRQHLKAMEGVMPAEDVVGVHLKATAKAAAATGEASSNITRSMGESIVEKEEPKYGNDNEQGSGLANGVMRAQSNRLWYH